MKIPFIGKIQFRILLGIIIVFYSCNPKGTSNTAFNDSDSLAEGFKNPPA